MKISIITVTYNSEKTLQDTIDSVLMQTYPDIEYIVVDGNSQDNTLNMIKENEPKFNGKMKWISEPDNGIYDAMNKGIKLATGNIIGILNSDDILADETTIEQIVSLFEENKCDAVYGNLIYQSNGKPVRHWKSNKFRSKSLHFGWMPPHPTLYCTKEVYDKLGIFDSAFRISADYDIILRIFKNKNLKSIYSPKTIVVMNQGGISNVSLKSKLLKSKEDYLVLKKNKINPPFLVVFFKNIRKFYQFIRARKEFTSSYPPRIH
ncbi:MAG: glycosyltransferase [Prevotellaceae bacterium]|nr:glycosyltransferase [Prevotellaceae bacterium]